MECMAKAIDGSGVVDQAKAEPVLSISGWMGDNLLKKSGNTAWWKGNEVFVDA